MGDSRHVISHILSKWCLLWEYIDIMIFKTIKIEMKIKILLLAPEKGKLSGEEWKSQARAFYFGGGRDLYIRIYK